MSAGCVTSRIWAQFVSGTSESSSIGSQLCHVVWGFVTADKMASLSGPEMHFRSHTGSVGWRVKAVRS